MECKGGTTILSMMGFDSPIATSQLKDAQWLEVSSEDKILLLYNALKHGVMYDFLFSLHH